MDFNRAMIFAKVVEARGFSAAGRLLNMPKTTISKHVSELEAELGLRLLNRTTRRVSPTEAGKRIYAHCVLALQHMEAARNEARAVQESPVGTLTVGAPGGIGVPFVMPVILAFMKRYPDVEVTLLTVNELVDLNEHQIEVMLWADEEIPPGHSVKLMSAADIGLYASTAYEKKHSLPTQVDELRDHQPVAFTQHMSDGHFVWKLHRDHEYVTIDPRMAPRFCSNDPAAVLTAVRAGWGIAPLPVQYVERVASGAGLIPVLPEWRLEPMKVCALFRDGAASTLAARIFRDFLAEGFRDLKA